VLLSCGLRCARGVRRLVPALLTITALLSSSVIAVEARAVRTAAADVSAPSWWSGDCDANWWNPQAAAKGWHGAGAHRLGAVYLGVPVCGPRRSGDGAPDVMWRRSGWGELEFECVELAMRFMVQVYGVAPYAANGDGVVRNYSTAYGGNLVKIANGTVAKAPEPGDVISFDNPYVGHVAVVTASSVNGAGDGSITMLSQNDTANGWRTLAVSHWRVAGFGNQTPYGWLHDPAGRGSPTHLATDAGYWMVEASGTVHAFGNAVNYGSSATSTVAIAPRRQVTGYWTVSASGSVRGFGAATVYGSQPALRFGESITTISPTPTGSGYWLFSNLGRAIAYGDAKLYGDMSTRTLNGPIVASVATRTGHGYYMVGSDGGIFTFGDAVFRGSMGAVRLHRPVVGISPTPDNSGYWLVASDGGVFAFHAPFRGSMGGVALNQPVNGLVAYGNGYVMVASDGGVFDFSDKAFAGSLGGDPPRTPIVGIASTA
jgi:CHAP domain